MTGVRKPGLVLVIENLPLPAARRDWQFAQTLAAEGWTVSVICPRTPGHSKPYELLDGVHIYRHPAPVDAATKAQFLLEYTAALFHEIRLLWRIHRRHGFNVILGCNPPDLVFLAAAPFKLLGKSFVFDHHDITPELFEVKFGDGRFRRLVQRLLGVLERLSYQTADHVICANDAFVELVSSRTRTPRNRITAVYGFPEETHVHRVEPDAHLRDDRVVLGYVGVIGNQDGVDHLVRALAHLTHELALDVRTIIVGDGPALRDVRALAAELEVDDRVEFTGFLTGNALLAALSAFDIGVIPDPLNSYNNHISMNKVYEYAALGLPIVGYRLEETVRLLEDAILVADGLDPRDLASAIQALCDDRGLRVELGERALRQSESRFSWSDERAKFLGVMSEVVATKA